MSDAYFSASRLMADRKFLISLVFSMGAALVGGLGSIQFVRSNKISLTSIADVGFVEHLGEKEGYFVTALLSKIDDVVRDKRAGGATLNKEILVGYIADFQDVCQKQINDSANPSAPQVSPLVIVRTSAGATAGTIEITTKTCDLVKELKGDEKIYATSDSPFMTIKSEKVHLWLKNNLKMTETTQ